MLYLVAKIPNELRFTSTCLHFSDEATMPDAYTKLEETKVIIDRIKSKWCQFDMDGTRNVWIVKPGAKSRGRGKKETE